jgi:hypothetical protein
VVLAAAAEEVGRGGGKRSETEIGVVGGRRAPAAMRRKGEAA